MSALPPNTTSDAAIGLSANGQTRMRYSFDHLIGGSEKRVMPGTAFVSSSSRLPIKFSSPHQIPVTLLPGWR
jgi:hypothetical protein